MSDSRKCLCDLGLLDAVDARIGFAHVGKQFIFRAGAEHRCPREPAVKTKGVIEIEAEGRNDRLAQTVERLRSLDFNIPIDRGSTAERGGAIEASLEGRDPGAAASSFEGRFAAISG